MSTKTKYIEQLVSELGFQHARKVDTPGLRVAKENEHLMSELISEEETRIYRGQVGRAMYVGHDRLDIQHTVMRLAQGMKAPTKWDQMAVNRMVRYLKDRKQLWHIFEERKIPDVVVTFSDADWAGAQDRRSTSGGIVTLGSAIVASWSRVQHSHALSSAEAEYVAIVMAYAEGKFVQTVLMEILSRSEPIQLRVLTDSSSAKAAAERAGIRRMKHFELKRLFIQDVVKSGELQLVKVGTANNPADVLTKMLSGPQIRRCMQMLPGLSHDDWPEDNAQQDADVQELSVFPVTVEQELG